MNKTTANKDFRYDINALRAIATLGVLFFHYKIECFSGGFTGVDVFFVISGFLMTKIIITSVEKNNFSYWDYLKKRLKRIVPALIFLLLIITIAGFLLYLPKHYKINEKNAASSVLFLSNILYWKSTNYFAPVSDTNILLHTWSLSVEWQFYLFYPWGIVLLNKILKKRNVFTYIFILITFLLFVFSISYAKHNPTAAFYLLPTRAWEMLLGGIAFQAEGLIKNLKLQVLVAGIGYFLILGSFIFLDATGGWPNLLTLVPVTGTFLVIIANDNKLFIIKNPVIQFIGKISYSLYLWHWPIYVVAQYHMIKFDYFSVAIFTALAVLIGYLSYKYIENVQYKSSAMILASMVLVFLITAALSKLNTNNFLFKKGTLDIASYEIGRHVAERKIQYREDTCYVTSFEQFDKKLCLCNAENKKNILLIGDSHMGQFSQSFRERGELKNIHFLQAAIAATLPVLNNYQHKPQSQRKLIDYIYREYIPKNANHIDGVILSSFWSGYESNIKQDSILLKSIKETVAYLNKFHIKTAIVGQTEVYSLSVPVFAAWDYERNTSSNIKLLNQRAFDINKYLKDNLGDNYIQVINTDHFPTVSETKIPYMVDNHHFSKYGADLIIDKLFANKRFLEVLNLQ